ncbi:MAG: hypothetical protein U1F27_14735 [Turneriella sp.]
MLRVQNLDAALDAALSDKVVQIRVQGESAAVKKLRPADFYAFVNAEDTRFNTKTGSILPYATESGVTVKARVLSGGKSADSFHYPGQSEHPLYCQIRIHEEK